MPCYHVSGRVSCSPIICVFRTTDMIHCSHRRNQTHAYYVPRQTTMHTCTKDMKNSGLRQLNVTFVNKHVDQHIRETAKRNPSGARSFIHGSPQLAAADLLLLALEDDLQRVSGTVWYHGQWATSPIHHLEAPKYSNFDRCWTRQGLGVCTSL
jgi:hypothetical protein